MHAVHQVFLVECTLESLGRLILFVDLPVVEVLHLHYQFLGHQQASFPTLLGCLELYISFSLAAVVQMTLLE